MGTKTMFKTKRERIRTKESDELDETLKVYIDGITCGTRGCGNSLTTRGLFKHGNLNVCSMCNEDMYGPAKEYGPAPGMESLAERKLREAKMKEEYARKFRELEEKLNAGPDDFSVCQVNCIQVASLVAL